jgi:hypothetical protein
VSDKAAANDRMRSVRKLYMAAAAIAGLVVPMAASGTMPDAAQAHCVTDADNQTIEKLNDKFRNFDYRSQDNTNRCYVDWPMDFLFYDNATINRVKTRTEAIGYSHEGDKFNAKLDDSAGWAWDQDGGRKNAGPNSADCWGGNVEHYRIYAVYNDDYMYNLDWGQYVLGTSHIDHMECTKVYPGDLDQHWSGDSETAEDRIAYDIVHAGAIGLGCVIKDDLPFGNHMDFAVADDGHVKNNSGPATSVCVR